MSGDRSDATSFLKDHALKIPASVAGRVMGVSLLCQLSSVATSPE
ncbi:MULTISPECIES: hypothetical protein [Asaia]